VDGTAVSALTNLYAAFLAAQLILIGIGLPLSFAVLLRDPVRAPQLLARVLDTWDGRLKIVIPIALLVFVAPFPAASGLVRMASAPDLRWPVDGWIVYLAVTATSLTLIWLVVAIVRFASPRSASPLTPAAPRFVASPPQGIAFVWEQGVRVIAAQLETADGLDRKITPLVAATVATVAIVVSQKETLGDFTGLLVLELAVAAVYLVLALVVRTFETVPRLAAIAPYAAASAAQLQYALLGNLVQANKRNDDALSGKTWLLNVAIAALFVFFATGFFAIQRLTK
jgi:hypothetical protein